MVLGFKALMFSTEFLEFEEPKQNAPNKFDKFIETHFGSKSQDIMIYVSIILAILFNIGLFILLPNLIASLFHINNKIASERILYNTIESVVRVMILLGYIILISRVKEIQRVYQYHGAEHKTIHCYEH